jgi:YbbR domain-containing protein
MEKLNRTPIIIISALFAIGLWLTVNLGFDYTTTRDIPIVIHNLGDDIAFRSTPPEYVRARVRGEGWKLLGMRISGDIKYILDLRDRRSSVTVSTSSDLPERLRMPTGINITEVAPTQFSIELEQKKERRIPIEPVIDITFRDGFNRVGEISMVPDSVVIRGAETVVSNFHTWTTKPLILRDVREPVRKSVSLSDTLSRILSLDIETCEVQFDVQPIAEKTISGLRVQIEGVPSNREVIIIPPRIDLIIRGGINQLAVIEDDHFSAQIHYRDILTDTSGTVIPRIDGPDEVRIVQRSPERVQYVIRRTP